jgi:hypothetical protein
VFGRAVTNADGRYRIGSLPPGTYLVRASDPAGHFSVEWYKEAAEVADAMPVEVPGGQVVDGIDFTLAPTQPVARLFVRPPVLGLTAGDDGDVAIAVANVANLAAFEVSLRWDPAVFTVDGVDPGEFLGSTGRQVIAVAPQIDNDQGTLHYGAASVGDAPGPNGEGVLFVIHLTAADHPGDSLLELTSSVLTDPAAVAIPHARDNGHVYVGRCMRGDFDCNCVIDIRDVMAVVLHWGTVHGDADYDALYDLDGDGDVDIVDVQIEASLWGQHCPTAPVADGASNDTSRASNDTSRAADGPVTDASTTVASTTDPIVRLTGPAGSVRSGAVSGMRPQGATLALAMVAGAPPTVGQELTVAVRVQDAVDLAGFDLALAYDPAALELKGAVLGDMLAASDRTFVRLGPTAVGGAVEVGAYSFPGAAAPQGAGDLVLLTFAVRAGGPSTLHVARATTVDSIGGSMPASAPDLDVAAVGVGNRYDLFVPYATGHD